MTARYYYREDGTSACSQVAVPGRFTGVVALRYDPLQGVVAGVPGADEKVLYLYDQVDRHRPIQYVVIQAYRNGVTQGLARAYGIRVSYVGSESTVFHDTCNDMEGFHSDPSFPFGARGDGELTVPSGQSYMTWSEIATGEGWHGPCYVHVLDRPFRLYQLSEFTVVCDLLQDSGAGMGKTYVALCDEEMRRVVMVVFGDSWSNARKGYVYAYFYPQDSGSPCRRWSGYSYTSFFQKTVTFSWGEHDGSPQGAVFTSTDGQAAPFALGDCNNASRVIKYVAILGYRYSSSDLVGMRIHDIRVVADLTRHDPTAPDLDEPVVYDGTADGTAQSAGRWSQAESFVASFEDLARDALELEWLGPWPTLKFTLNLVIGLLTFSMVFYVDLLGTLTTESCIFSFPFLESMSDADFESSVGRVLRHAAIRDLTICVTVSLTMAQFFATFQLIPHSRLLFTVSMLAYTGFAFALIVNIAQGYLFREIAWRDAVVSLFVLTWGIVFGGDTLAAHTFFCRVFTPLRKYRVETIEEWGYHDTFLQCARTLLLLLGLGVMAGIYLSGPK